MKIYLTNRNLINSDIYFGEGSLNSLSNDKWRRDYTVDT